MADAGEERRRQMNKDIEPVVAKIAFRWLKEKQSQDADLVFACTAYDLADEFQTETGINVSIDDLEDIFISMTPCISADRARQ